MNNIPKSILKDKTILITGGTGSFGNKFSEIVLNQYPVKKIIIYSRDEYKQFQMSRKFSKFDNIRFFIGDVRDKCRLKRALSGVDYVVHAAALKQVPAMEYNPSEAIKTNVMGAMNLIESSLDANIDKVIALSTDKACNPINLYGATKLCADKLFVAGNAYSGKGGTKFSVVRYGNVIGSRGSVIPFFKQEREKGVLPITHELMTRFWVTLEETVEFVIENFKLMEGGEIFVPQIPSMKMTDLAKAMAPECKLKIIGIRPGEKMHESMISKDDAWNTKELKNRYIIIPAFPWWDDANHSEAKDVPEGFQYSSDINTSWLSVEELREMIK